MAFNSVSPPVASPPTCTCAGTIRSPHGRGPSPGCRRETPLTSRYVGVRARSPVGARYPDEPGPGRRRPVHARRFGRSAEPGGGVLCVSSPRGISHRREGAAPYELPLEEEQTAITPRLARQHDGHGRRPSTNGLADAGRARQSARRARGCLAPPTPADSGAGRVERARPGIRRRHAGRRQHDQSARRSLRAARRRSRHDPVPPPASRLSTPTARLGNTSRGVGAERELAIFAFSLTATPPGDTAFVVLRISR